MEVRHSPDKSRITGCISGLGPRTDWEKPLEEVTRAESTEAFYPEHDIETRFDVNVTNHDINSINKVSCCLLSRFSGKGKRHQ